MVEPEATNLSKIFVTQVTTYCRQKKRFECFALTNLVIWVTFVLSTDIIRTVPPLHPQVGIIINKVKIWSLYWRQIEWVKVRPRWPLFHSLWRHSPPANSFPIYTHQQSRAFRWTWVTWFCNINRNDSGMVKRWITQEKSLFLHSFSSR